MAAIAEIWNSVTIWRCITEINLSIVIFGRVINYFVYTEDDIIHSLFLNFEH